MKKALVVLFVLAFYLCAWGDMPVLYRTGVQFDVTTAVDFRGNLYAAYVDSNSPNNSALYLTYSTDGGRNFEPSTVLDFWHTCRRPNIATIDTEVVIAYEDASANDIYMIKGSPGSFGDTTAILNSSLPELEPSLAVDTLNYLYVVYAMGNIGSRQLYYMYSDDRGETFSTPVQITTISSGDVFHPTARVRGGGSSAILYISFSYMDGDTNVGYVGITQAGSSTPSVGGLVPVSHTSRQEIVQRGGMDVSERGDVTIAYDEATAGGNYSCMVRHKSYTMPTFSSPYPLLIHSPGAHRPQVIADVRGNLQIIWQQYNGTDYDIIMAYSENYGISYSGSRIRLNDDLAGVNHILPVVSNYASPDVRRVFFCWLDDRYGNPDIFGDYLVQFGNEYVAKVVYGGYIMGGYVNGGYRVFFEDRNIRFYQDDTLFIWSDSASTVTAESLSTGSTTSQRWARVDLEPWEEEITGGGVLNVINYYHQYNMQFNAVSLPSGTDPMDATNSIPLWGTSFAEIDTFAFIYDGHPGSIWADRGTRAYLKGISTGSGTSERWIHISEADSLSFNSYEPIDTTLYYWHQYICDIALPFTDSEHTIACDSGQVFGAQDRPTGLYDEWLTWRDAGSYLSIVDTTTGDPAHWTSDITDWVVDRPVYAVVSYNNFYTGTNFMMIALSDTSMELMWIDFPNEDYYLVLNARDTSQIAGIDTIPANNTHLIVNGLEPNTAYFWMIGGYTASGDPSYSNALSTYTLTPNPPDTGTIVDRGDNFAVLSIPAFPNDRVGNSAYVWNCVEGEGVGGVDTVFTDGTTTWLLSGLTPGNTYSYYIKYLNGDGMPSVDSAFVTFTIQEGYTYMVNETASRGWNMIAASLAPSPAYPVSQFADDISPFYTSQWNSNIYQYDETRGTYTVPDTLLWGKGYFLFPWYGGTTVDMYGSARYETCDQPLTYTPSFPYSGWNLVGNPYTTPIRWEDILYSHQTYRVDNTYYTWTDMGWAFYSPYFAGGVGPYIQPFMGFEVHAWSGGGNLHMTYPLYSGPYRKGIAKKEELPKVRWALKLSAKSKTQPLADAHNYIINTEADNCIPFDIPEPPIFGYLSLYFEDEKSEFLTARGINLDKVGSYQASFYVESNHPGEIELSFGNLQYIPEEVDIEVIDLLTEESIDPRETSRYAFNLEGQGFDFNYADPPSYGDGLRRKFQIRLSKGCVGCADGGKVPAEICLAQPYPNPFNSEVQLRYTINELTDVTLVVYDIIGSPVRTILRRTMDAGTYKTSFDARDDYGRELPSGCYFIRLFAGDEAHTRKVLLMR